MCHQRLYFLRKLKKFGVGQATLIQFYRGSIESILAFSITVWYGSLTAGDMARLDKIVFTASKIIGARLSPLDAIYQSRSDRKVRAILSFSDHPAHRLFECLPSGRRFRSIPAKTDRFRDSFYVRAVRGARPLRRQEPPA